MIAATLRLDWQERDGAWYAYAGPFIATEVSHETGRWRAYVNGIPCGDGTFDEAMQYAEDFAIDGTCTALCALGRAQLEASRIARSA